MSDDPLSLFARRIERLEQENRRLKRGGVVCFGIAVLLSVGGAKLAEGGKTIETQKLLIRDENGQDRAIFQGTNDGAMLTMSDATGSQMILIRVSPKGANVFMNSSDGGSRAVIAVSSGGFPPSLQLKTDGADTVLLEPQRKAGPTRFDKVPPPPPDAPPKPPPPK